MCKKMRIHYEINYPKKKKKFLYLVASPSIEEEWNLVREKKHTEWESTFIIKIESKPVGRNKEIKRCVYCLQKKMAFYSIIIHTN